jgi:Effector-associated domain 11/inactive STAND
MNPKEKIRQLVGEAKLKEALQLFAESLSAGDSVSQNDIIQLNQQLSALNRDIQEGIISKADETVEFNRITKRISALLDTSQNNNIVNGLDRAIQALPIAKDAELGFLQMVNCDRRGLMRKFNRIFEEKKQAKQPFQFYFLSACPTEMPHSLASRIAYELKLDTSEEGDKPIDYVREGNESESIKIQPLPFSDKGESASRNRFKSYFQERFKLSDGQMVSFLETGVPKLLYSHVLTVFQITEDKWHDDDGEVVAYLQWLVDTFQKAHPDLPTFIFLFVVEIKHLYDATKVKAAQNKVINDLEAFCQKNETAIFRELMPLKDLDLEGWLKNNLGVNNPNDITPLLTAFNESLAPVDQLIMDGEPRFHMKDVQQVQEKVVRYFRNK